MHLQGGSQRRAGQAGFTIRCRSGFEFVHAEDERIRQAKLYLARVLGQMLHHQQRECGSTRACKVAETVVHMFAACCSKNFAEGTLLCEMCMLRSTSSAAPAAAQPLNYAPLSFYIRISAAQCAQQAAERSLQIRINATFL